LTHRKPYHIIYTWQGKVCPHLPTSGTRQKKHMTVFKILKKVADKVSDTMETKKKFTVSRRRMKKAGDPSQHSAFKNARVTGEGVNRNKTGKAMFSSKGSSYKDVSELNRHMEHQDSKVERNVNTFKLLKSVRDKVKKKEISKKAAKNARRLHRMDIVEPGLRSMRRWKKSAPPGGAESKAHRSFKKGVKKELKRSEREDSLKDIKRDMTIDLNRTISPTSKLMTRAFNKPSMFIKRKN
jgi:hypothetical protein